MNNDELSASGRIPQPVKLATEWAWRFIVIAAAIAVVLLIIWRLKLVFLALFVAMLLTALLTPLLRGLRSIGLPRGLASALTVLFTLAVLVGTAVLIGRAVAGQWSELSSNASQGVGQVRDWLNNGPLHLSDSQIDKYVAQAWDALKGHQQQLTSGALGAAATALEVVSGALIALFATIFFLYDGERIWSWLLNLFPRSAQADADASGRIAWSTLTAYIRGTIVVAFVDAFFIGLAIALVRVPLAIPLAVLVFFGAFIPIVGATVTGAIACFVALATKGLGAALLVLAAVILVQQLEGHVLQPFLLGRMVNIHPLGVVLAVTAGGIVAGLVGAIVAVPLVAVLTKVIGYYGAKQRGGSAAAREEMAEEEESPLADKTEPVKR
jgi:predicted PurR-regulated permease PerM